MTLTRGNLYRYNYLWSRQFHRGEESGRKARPVCLVVRIAGNPATLFLFPLTSQRPPSEITSLQISEAECRQAGLDHPSWLVLEEYNRVDEDELYDFESLVPIGRFSDATLRKIIAVVQDAAKRRRLKAVPRT